VIENRDIVCFSTDWGGHVDSSHHLMRRLMERNRVLWVNSTGLRAPKLSAYDARRAWRKLFGRGTTPGETPPGPAGLFSPRVVPLYGSRLANAYNRRVLTRGLRASAAELGLSDVVVFACLPTAVLGLDAFDPALVVYYVMDDYPLMPGVNTRAMRALEEKLFDRSDVVLVTADQLKETKAACGKPITVVPHGAEFDHFHGPRPEPPRAMAGIDHPLVGFFGLLAPWIDTELIGEVARANPSLAFVFIGDVQADVEDLRRLPNVHLLPKVPYADLPAYARQFDVSILPFVVDEMTVNVNPLKLMEYFAVGAPVVSTPLPAVAAHQPHARTAETPDQFSRAIREALWADSAEARAARIELARRHSWDSRVEQVSGIIERALAEKGA
jgi:glycosyltransferase involved in cell wall biosynthesis